jgi:hypothetical protein
MTKQSRTESTVREIQIAPPFLAGRSHLNTFGFRCFQVTNENKVANKNGKASQAFFTNRKRVKQISTERCKCLF